MNTPTYNEISGRAQTLWRERSCPHGSDTEIWLEAERQLRQGSKPAGVRRPESFTERAKAETAAESVVEYHLSPAASEQDAIRSAMPKTDSRAPLATPEFRKARI